MAEINETQRKKIVKVGLLETFAELVDTLYGSPMGASGQNHAPGQVPDPGATAGTSKFLCEDGTWKEPSGGNGGGNVSVMGASGTNHASGLVPDPGAIAGTSKYLREDGTWKEPSIEGEFPELTAGNIVGEFSDTNAEFAYRPSAGAVDIESGKVDHGGHLEAVKGNTVAWNQMIENGDFSDGTNGWSYGGGFGNPTVSDGIMTIENRVTKYNKYIRHDANIVIGHKYLYYFNVASSASRTCSVSFSHDHKDGEFIATTPTLSLVKGFAVATYDEYFEILFVSGEGTADETFQFSKFMLFDLTLIYGAGNEPTTVAQFESDYIKWFGKPLSYEAYDEGSLRDVMMTGIKTVGFNQVKSYTNTNESRHYYPALSVETNQLFPGKQYAITFKGVAGTRFYVNENIFRIQVFTCTGNLQTLLVTALDNPAYQNTYSYVLFKNDVDNSSTPNFTDVCLNLHHSGDKDGQYEPYWESTLNVPVTSLTGKLNGEGSSVVVFPDGMKRVGDVYDEIVKVGGVTKAIKRVGKQTIQASDVYGDGISGGSNIQRVLTKSGLFPNYKYTDFDAIQPNTKCSKIAGNAYKMTHYYIQPNIWAIFQGEFSCSIDGLNTVAGLSAICPFDIYYELETPEEYILDDFELPVQYDVDDWGTEEILLGTDGVAPVLDLKYGINAGDTIKNLPHSYVSAVGEQQFNEAQKARARKNIGITIMGASGSNHLSGLVPDPGSVAGTSKFLREDGTWQNFPTPKLQQVLNLSLQENANGHPYIEIGGVKWATVNIGAENNYDAGMYFAWADAQGYTAAQVGSDTGQKNFNWNTYKYGDGTSSNVSVSNMTKYNDVDGKTTLDDEDDAAKVNWGGDWRVPTQEEFESLIEATTQTETTLNGIKGMLFTDKTDSSKTIFLPLSSISSGTMVDNSVGRYHMSSLDPTNKTKSKQAYVQGTMIIPYAINIRSSGACIRAVLGGNMDGTKFLSGDYTWKNPPVTSTDLATKQDKLSVVSLSASSFTAVIDRYYNISNSVGTMTITLPTMTDSTKTAGLMILFTTGSSPALTINSASNLTISYFSGYTIEANSNYELNCLWNGTKWIIAYGTIG